MFLFLGLILALVGGAYVGARFGAKAAAIETAAEAKVAAVEAKFKALIAAAEANVKKI
jgi:hypothetical protein